MLAGKRAGWVELQLLLTYDKILWYNECSKQIAMKLLMNQRKDKQIKQETITLIKKVKD